MEYEEFKEIVNKLWEEYPDGIPGEIYDQYEREYWDSQPDVQRMREKMEKFKPFFADMVTPENKFSYDEVMLKVAFGYTKGWEAQFSGADFSITFTRAALKKRPDLLLLHEMVHMHINVMSVQEKEQCRRLLKKELAEKIPQLDEIINYCQDYMETLPPGHDGLFFLKCLDVDLRKKYKLGQTCDYGLRYVIEDVLKYKSLPISKKILLEKREMAGA